MSEAYENTFSEVYNMV